ncbi:MAG: hypothetical protein ACI80I_000843 [Akkermansiaceae bacterium]|jgi:hypothetical protein
MHLMIFSFGPGQDCGDMTVLAINDEAALRVVPACSAPSKQDHFGLEFPTATFLPGEGVEAMKASKFTEAQKAFIVKQGSEGTAAALIVWDAN